MNSKKTSIMCTDTVIHKNRQKSEAISRMKSLGVPNRIINDYETIGRVWISTPLGKYTEVTNELSKKIRMFEAKYNVTVYMVIRDFFKDDILDSLLFVSRHEDEWEKERDDIQANFLMTYTINWSHDFCSEFGSIIFKRHPNGGIVRWK